MSLGGEVTGTVTAGRFALEVGSSAGTRAYFAPERAGDSTGLRVAFDQAPSPGEEALEAAEGALEETTSVTGRVERALELFTAIAQGRVLDRKVLQKEIDSLLGALERLDRQGRYRDALRLARVLAGLLALASRWVSLVDTLRVALRAASALGDAPGIAWARHELGTLALGAEDASAANGELSEALRLREDLGDERGADTTRHNLSVMRQAFGGGGGGPRPLVVAAVIGAVLLVAALGALVAMRVLDDDDEPPVVDTVAPAVEILEGPEDPTEETSAAFVFEADEDVRRFECRLDDGAFEECVSPQNIPGPLSVGRHVFAVRAVDFAANSGQAATYEWTIEEGVGPSVTILEGPPPLTNETTARFSLEAPGAIRLECRLDGGDFEECPTIVVYEDVGEGEHTFVARAFDAGDNRGPPARHRWTVDATAPTVEIGELEFPEAGTVQAPFTADESGSVVECVIFRVVEGQREELAREEDCESPFTFEELEANNDYVIAIAATDAAGNTGEPAEEEFDTVIVE